MSRHDPFLSALETGAKQLDASNAALQAERNKTDCLKLVRELASITSGLNVPLPELEFLTGGFGGRVLLKPYPTIHFRYTYQYTYASLTAFRIAECGRCGQEIEMSRPVHSDVKSLLSALTSPSSYTNPCPCENASQPTAAERLGELILQIAREGCCCGGEA